MFLAMLETPEEKERFTHLYEEYEKTIYTNALQILRNELDAEMVVLETFEAIVQKMDLLVTMNDKQIASYITRATKNMCFKVILVRNRTENIENHDQIPSPETPDIHVERCEAVAQLKAFIRALPREEREIILLTYSTGLSVKDIAHMLNKPKSTIYHYLSVAKAKITNYMRGTDLI